MTIYELKRLNEANGGKFFNRDTMKFWKDTLKNFKVEKVDDDQCRVTRRTNANRIPTGGWLFNSHTGRKIRSLI